MAFYDLLFQTQDNTVYESLQYKQIQTYRQGWKKATLVFDAIKETSIFSLRCTVRRYATAAYALEEAPEKLRSL